MRDKSATGAIASALVMMASQGRMDALEREHLRMPEPYQEKEEWRRVGGVNHPKELSRRARLRAKNKRKK